MVMTRRGSVGHNERHLVSWFTNNAREVAACVRYGVCSAEEDRGILGAEKVLSDRSRRSALPASI